MSFRSSKLAGTLAAGTALMAALSAGPVQAQTYSCLSASGKRYQSPAPCPTGGRSQGMVYYGPQPSLPRPPTAMPIERATEELTYMSPECALMKEGLRTARARGVDSRTHAELRRNFQQKCQENQAEAYRQLSEEERARRNQAQAEKRQHQEKRTLAAADEQKLLSQCAEMRGAIRQRRARQGMSEGELRDLALFEERYQNRCVSASR